MPEIKHTFTSGKMNKDLDERLVPNGEYRDAQNVEVVTSEGSDVGTVQTCLGNNLISDLAPDDESTCVGSIIDDKTNSAYYLIAGAIPPVPKSNDHTISSDLVVEYNSVSNETLPVIVDIYNVQTQFRTKHGWGWFNTNFPDFAAIGRNIYSVIGDYANTGQRDGYGLRVGMEVNIELVGHPSWQQSVDKPIIIGISGFRINGANSHGQYISLSSPIRRDNGVELTNSFFSDPQHWNNSEFPARVNFTSPRVLNFHRDNLITGVNIIDDMLFWCDGVDDDDLPTKGTEPKKVNITRGKEGSIPELGVCQNCHSNHNVQNPYTYNGTIIPGTTHTELVVNEVTVRNIDQNGVLLNPPFGVSEYIKEEHITVAKKAPLTPPKLDMFGSIRRFSSTTGLIHNVVARETLQNWWGNDPKDPSGPRILAPLGMTSAEWNTVNVDTPPNPAPPGGNFNFDERMGYFHLNYKADYRVGDVLLLTDDKDKAEDSNGDPLPFSGDDVRIKLKVISSDSTATDPKLVNSPGTVGGNLEVKILYIDNNIEDQSLLAPAEQSLDWWIRLEDKTQSLYELKFPKFAYRYKYEDGEYSTFSPFSEIAFLPQKFDYHPKKGYNTGMVNDLRQLFIKDFIPPNIPLDVVEIDILYKESNSPNIYTIRSFKELDPEWHINGTGSYRGYFEIKDDLIHAVVASNQLLRPWDNVPRKALGQETTGNRLVYGNYIQNYDLESASLGGDILQVKPEFKTTIESDIITTTNHPETSLKSMRTYQLGVIYKDIYGRETPVITHPSGVAKLDASKAVLNNKFTVQAITPPPFWADSFKYFVKETSNEYYNLAMDRWYDAEEGEGTDLPNIWLSFPSEDRNKIDDETTLILKKTLETEDNPSKTGFVSESPRKKILAIENEAPDFIKTTWAPIGLWNSKTTDSTSSAGATVGNFSVTPDGFPYEDRAFVKIHEKEWEKSEFSSLQNKENTILNGGVFDNNTSLMIRFSDVDLGVQAEGAGYESGGKLSKWYNISNVSFNGYHTQSSGSGAGHFTINIDGSFGDDVNFLAEDGLEANIIEGIYVEIAKKTIENKPEFDGRFFVKVEYDGLETYLGSASKVTTQQNWIVNSNVGTLPIYWLAGGGTSVATSPSNLFPCATKFDDTLGVSGETVPQDMTGFYGDSAGGPFTDPPRTIWYNNHGYGPLLPFPPAGTGSSSYPGGPHHPLRTIAQWKVLYKALFPLLNPPFSSSLEEKSKGGWFIDSEPAVDNEYGMSASASATPRNYVMAKAGLGADIGKSKITISKLSAKTGATDPNDLEKNFLSNTSKAIAKKLDTKGTRFRFASDPEKIVYEIGSSSWGAVSNYLHYDVHSQEAMKHRIRFTIDLIEPFSRTVDDPSGIVKLIGETVPGATISTTAFAPCDYSQVDHTFTSNENATESNTTLIEFVEPSISHQKRDMPSDPAVWETEPKDDVGLDIYYEIGQSYPVNMCDNTEELYIQEGATVSMHKSNTDGQYSASGWIDGNIWVNGAQAPNSVTGNTTILSNVNTVVHPSTTNNFSHSGYQSFMTNTATGNYEIRLNTAFNGLNTNIVAGLPVTDNTNSIPAGTTVSSVSIHTYTSGGIQQRILLSNPTPNVSFMGAIQMVLTFTATTHAINEPSVVVPTVVSSIIGCAGDTPPNQTQPSTLLEFNNGQVLNSGDVLSFTNPDGTTVTATVAFDSPTRASAPSGIPQNQIYLRALTHGEKQTLTYYNCYAYGNGVESNRIRDLFNAVTIDKGVKASTTLAEQYKEEDRKSGLIFSGIYNSMNGVNRLNQFIMADNITKDLNPEYGSIQKLHTRDDDLVTLCEDKIVKVLANKDALFNADDSKNITTSSNVLGYAKPFVGEFGISKNPESFASEAFRAYFTDKERGAVMRLSRDGLTPISDHGMKDWFADNLNTADKLIGSYDNRKSLYNITLQTSTPAITPHGEAFNGGEGGPLQKIAPVPSPTPGLTIDIPPTLTTTTIPPPTPIIVEPPLLPVSTTTKFEKVPDLKYDPTDVRITDIRPSDFIPVEFIPGETPISEGEGGGEGGGESQDVSDSGSDSGGSEGDGGGGDY